MQNIYDNDYSFAKPPLKPTMTAVPGDNKVTLYWNSFSEKSIDPIYGNDFEGYRVYRVPILDLLIRIPSQMLLEILHLKNHSNI